MSELFMKSDLLIKIIFSLIAIIISYTGVMVRNMENDIDKLAEQQIIGRGKIIQVDDNTQRIRDLEQRIIILEQLNKTIQQNKLSQRTIMARRNDTI